MQGIAADLLMEAMLRLEAAGYEIALTVHDECLTEKAIGDEKEFAKIMAKNPKWGEGIPIEVETWSGPRYKKG